jgi:OOP family OmpA-OmpF porin
MIKHSIVIAALAVASALPALAQAQSTNTRTTQPAPSGPMGFRMPWQSGFWSHVGIAGGTAEYNGCAGGNCGDNDTAWRIFAGGKFNDTIGFEASYFDLGRTSGGGGSVEADGINLSALFGFPVGASSSIHAKLGTSYGQTRTTANLAGAANGTERSWGLSYGLGGSLGLSQNVQLRLDWDRYRMEFAGGRDDDVDALTVGVQWRF